MNLTTLLDMAADAFGERVLVGTQADGLSAAGLRAAALNGASVVSEANASAIVHASTDGPGFAVALFAASYAGVPLIPVDAGLRAEHLNAHVAHHPGALVVTDQVGGLLNGQTVTRVLSTAQWRAVTIDRSKPALQHVSSSTDSDAPAVLIYTSGVNSTPKGVVLRHAHLMAYVRNATGGQPAGPEEAALLGLPLFEAVAITHLLKNIYAGRRSIFLTRLEAAEWLATARREEVTSALVGPPLLAQIVSGGDRARSATNKAVPTLRTLEYGGAPLALSVIRKARTTWPHLNFLNEYWLAETSSTIAQLTEPDYRKALKSHDPFVRARLGSVGRAIPGIDIEIRNAQGAVVLPGERGRIWVRGAQVSAEYERVGPRLDANDFFDTGDGGFVDEDGFLFLDGRSDEAIVRGEKTVAPAEVEGVLLRHPAVVDAAVIGIPSAGADQRIFAVVVKREDAVLTARELREFARSKVSEVKAPDEIVFWPELPRTRSGKLMRRNVALQVQTDQA